jgi:mono/diheme cytochrome c family protein
LKRIVKRIWATSLLALLVGILPARADRLVQPTHSLYQNECGSCHLAYPPALLPATSWRALMEGLPHHFGVDASLDAPAARKIGDFLERHAQTRRKYFEEADKPVLRITETRWFNRKHREVAPAVFAHPKVKSAANCGACHMGAERGDFDEHAVRLPR